MTFGSGGGLCIRDGVNTDITRAPWSEYKNYVALVNKTIQELIIIIFTVMLNIQPGLVYSSLIKNLRPVEEDWIKIKAVFIWIIVVSYSKWLEAIIGGIPKDQY